MKLSHLIHILILLSVAVSVSTVEAEDESAAAEQKVAAELKAVAGTSYVQLRGRFPLRSGFSLFAAQALTLPEACDLIDQAMATQTQQVVIDCSASCFPGMAAAEELAGRIRAAQKTGKKRGRTVSCVLDNANDSTLIIAAACDEVLHIQAGISQVDGLALYLDYYSAALQKIGIRFHAVTSGPQKTAPEFLCRERPSAAALAESKKLLDGIEKGLLTLSERGVFNADKIIAARGLSPQTSALCVSTGIADREIDMGRWQESLPAPVTRISRTNNKPDVSSFSGMMAMWSQLIRGPQDDKPQAFVAILELEGNIVDGDGKQPGLITALGTVREIQKLRQDTRVKAVLIRMNSGGGSASASDRIYHEVKRLVEDKPCAILMDGVAASGGYYIACGAQRIYAHHLTITGSIGVFALMPDMSAMRDALGVHRHVISNNPRAQVFDSGAFTEDKKAALRTIIDDVDQRFQGIVADARGLSTEAVAALANGRVYVGDEALALGLVDEIGSCGDALGWLNKQIPETGNLPTYRFPEQEGLSEMLGMGLGIFLPPSIRALVAESEHGRIHVYTWMTAPLIE